jgi:type II secretory ATPase GspE/PulE/Tfp pilus assembly ATPase PilB-like protein
MAPEAGPAATRRGDRLGTLLVSYGLVTSADIERALEEQRRSGLPIGDALVKLGCVDPADLEWAIAERVEIPFHRFDPDAVDSAVVRLLPEEFCRARTALAFKREGNTLTLLVSDPLDRRTVADARRLTGMAIVPGLARAADIIGAIDAVYGDLTQTFDRPPADLLEDLPSRSEDGADLVRPLLEAAARAGVPRIVLAVRGDGFEATGFRTDRAAGERSTLLLRGDAEKGRALLARLQSLAGLPAGRPPHPVHGSFQSHGAGGRTVDYELFVVPALRGEQAAIEVRPEAAPARPLASLGLLPGDLARLRGLLGEPEGFVALVGAPGQGKTTLFAAILEHLAGVGRRVVSLERTVSTPNASIVQVRRPESDAFGSDAWVDAVLRLVPDVAAFDDLPESGACARAIRAALVGTLVVYSLPFEDVVGAARFLESLPAGRNLVAAALAGVVAVRLVREACRACREKTELPLELMAAVALEGGKAEGDYVRCRGCAACSFTGAAGRRPIFEVVALDRESRAKLVERRGAPGADLASLLAAARPDSIRVQAVRLAAEGTIPVDELAHVL